MGAREERIWAGSETSLQVAVEAETAGAAKLAAGAFDQQDEEEETPRLLEVSDGIATISIKGPLVNSDSPWLQYCGVTGYPEIRDALLAAANDGSVQQILLDIDSGGGAVSGVDDTAKLIRLINDQVKPVSTYTDGIMASAAYWLGSAAGAVFSGKSALVGSIGVIATHKEQVEANKMEGIGVTVIRAGKFKALANSNETLSAAGRAQIQHIVDAAYTVFVDHVSAMRGKSYEYADKTMADGQEFIGQAALDVGLVDGLTTYDALVSDLKQKILASSTASMDNHNNDSRRLLGASTTELSGDADMAKKALTEQNIAALAAGAALVLDAGAGAQLDATADAVALAASDATAAAVSDATAVASLVDVAAAIGAGGGDQHAQNVDTINATVQLLNSQLAAKDSQLLEAGIKTAKLQEQLDGVQATHAPMLEIVGKSINNMRIALNESAMSIEGMGAIAVLAEHTRMADQFQSKFKAGSISAVSGDATAPQPQVDPRHLARVNAARFNQ